MQIGSELRRDLKVWLGITLASSTLGTLFGFFAYGTPLAILQGALVGGMISSVIAAVEIFGIGRAWVRPLRRMPFLVYFTLRAAFYVVAILAGIAAGLWLGGVMLGIPERLQIESKGIIFSLTVSLVMNVTFAINQLLGQRVLWNFVAGRYVRPRVEDRVLLFIDMEGSTQIAERLGEVRYLDFLNRFVADVVAAILLQRGEIHKYVGDEIIATWPLAAGITNARAVRASFGALRLLQDHADDYVREFGLAAHLRAALHCGPVVRGELGTVKMEIALIGDTVNTTARIQQACRELGQRVLASGDLIARLADLPPGIASHALGPVVLRGKESAVELYALTPADALLSGRPRAASG